MKTFYSSLQYHQCKSCFSQTGLLLLLLGFIVSTTACSDKSQQSAQVGAPFPLSELNQNRHLQQKNLNLTNKNLLINFWATWCRPCREEMPYLQQLSESLDSNEYAIIGISVDDDINLVKEFLLQYSISYPNYLDVDQLLATEQFGIIAFPETILVSSESIIINRISGKLSPQNSQLQQFLKLPDISNRQSQSGLSTSRPL